MKGNRIGWIDELKGIAIILVVVRHVMQANILDCSNTIIGNAIFAVQMPLFMAIAGFFSVSSNMQCYKNVAAIIQYIKKRAVHYMLPFFSWFIFVCVLLRGFYNRNIVTALLTLTFNVDVGLWFLYVVFVLSVINVLSNIICSKLNLPVRTGIIPILVGGGLLLPLLILGRLFGLRFLGINLILYYYLFFALGRLLFCNQKFIRKCFYSPVILYGIGILMLGIFFLVIFNHNIELAPDGIFNICLRVVAAISGCTAITIGTYIFSRRKTNGILRVLGQNTLEIYVVHVHYIGLLPKGNHYFCTIDGAVTLFISLLTTIVLSTITIMAIKKISVLNFIFFGKLPSER